MGGGKRNNSLAGSEYRLSSIIHKRIMKFREENKDDDDLEWKCNMIRAGISKEFWDIELDNFIGNKKVVDDVRKYCSKLEVAKEHGFGFLFMGLNGRGKTSMMMVILKEALRQGYTAFYITMPRIFKQIYLGWEYPNLVNELNQIVRSVDFLAIGELGKDYHRKDSTEFARAEFDCLFRERRELCLPIMMDTNYDKEDLEETYGASLMSLFESRMKFVEMKGRDYRKVVQSREWGILMS